MGWFENATVYTDTSSLSIGWSAGPHFWIFGENAVAVIGACLPTLARLWKRQKRTPWSYSDARSYQMNSKVPGNSSIRQLVDTSKGFESFDDSNFDQDQSLRVAYV